MNKVSIDFENCFGIGYLSKTFSFNDKKIISIYARNGIMKTSFAKTFYELSTGGYPRENVYNKTPKAIIKIDEEKIEKYDNILVIKALEDTFLGNDDAASSLLVNKKLKEKYDEIYKEIIKKKNELIKALSKKSGTKNETENIINRDFNEKNIFETFYKLFKLTEELTEDLSSVKYADIFNSDTEEILLEKDVENSLVEYLIKYKEIVKKYPFFKEESFNPTKARLVFDSLEKQTFFEPGNTVNLQGESDPFDKKKLENKLNSIEEEIHKNGELKDIFEKIKKKADGRKFQDLIVKNDFLLKHLAPSERINLKKKLWRNYLIINRNLLNDFGEYYSKNKEELKKIEEVAKKEKPLWDETIKIFNERFKPPFEPVPRDRESVILGKKTLNIDFKFCDDKGNEKYFSKEEIDGLKFLSQGEKRILYLLYVIFEIQKRKKEGIETLIIIDDIADSFDYKNKYGIIQYLKDISEIEDNLFYQIILTHNFDFFRVIFRRLNKDHEQFYFAEKEKESKIILRSINDLHIIDPFHEFIKNNGENPKKIIALIPFVRNIISYNKEKTKDDYDTLTNILHFRKKGKETKFIEIYKILNKYSDIKLEESSAEDIGIIEKIYSVANELIKNEGDFFQLEDKLILSMVIRLSSERFIKNRLGNRENLEDKKTFDLIDEYKRNFKNDYSIINILDAVQIMTPENIHVNTFMYEPILDMPCDELIDLYKKVKDLE